MLRLLKYVGTRIFRAFAFVKKTIRMMQPSHVISLVHIDPYGKTITPIFKKGFSNDWSKSFTKLMFISNDGYYVFKLWNACTLSHEHIILNKHHICEALGIKYPSIIWVFSEFGLVSMLSSYVQMMSRRSSDFNLFAVMINGSDASFSIHPYIRSITIPQNITPSSLILLNVYANNHNITNTSLEHDIYTIDYELNEHRFDPHQHIVV
jgi:hypothetical protein